MARKQLTDEEREQIRKSLVETRERRKTQIIKVFELKVNCHQTTKEIFEKMKQCFIQAKWIYNDMLNHSQTKKEHIFKYEYIDHKIINRYNKNKEYVEEYITLPVYFHRGIVARLKQI